MDQVFTQPMRNSTYNSIEATKSMVGVGIQGERAVYKRKAKTSAFETFYRQNKEIVRRAGILLLLFLITNLITCLVTSNKIKTRLESEYQISLQEEISATRLQVESEMRDQYGADEVDAQIAKINEEADLLAKMLYAYRNNTDEGVKSATWCVLCRVNNPAYPDTVSDVVHQNDQWMGFSDDNPVVQRLKDIAADQLRIFYSGSALPMSPEYVFMSWNYKEITLRSTFEGKAGCHYWYESDWI